MMEGKKIILKSKNNQSKDVIILPKDKSKMEDYKIYETFLNTSVRVVKDEGKGMFFTIYGIITDYNSKGILLKMDKGEVRFIKHISISEIIKLGDKQ